MHFYSLGSKELVVRRAFTGEVVQQVVSSRNQYETIFIKGEIEAHTSRTSKPSSSLRNTLIMRTSNFIESSSKSPNRQPLLDNSVKRKKVLAAKLITPKLKKVTEPESPLCVHPGSQFNSPLKSINERALRLSLPVTGIKGRQKVLSRSTIDRQRDFPEVLTIKLRRYSRSEMGSRREQNSQRQYRSQFPDPRQRRQMKTQRKCYYLPEPW